MYVCMYIYISPNYSRGLLNCRKYHDPGRFSVDTLVRNRHFPPEFATLSKKRRPMSPKRRVLPSKSWPLPPPPKKTATLSRIRAPGALGPAIWATRPPAARQNTVLSERPWLLSRARGWVRFGNAQHYRESTSRMASGAVICGISGDAVWRIRNTHGDLASRPAAGPVIYGRFGDAVFETCDTQYIY